MQINLDAGYLSCLENPTDGCSIVCDAKEDVLATYQKTAGDLLLFIKFEHMHGVFGVP